MNPNFVLRSGKYQGMTYEWVCENNPSYVEWIKENQPNMLLEKVTTVTKLKETNHEFGKLSVNMNFDNEGPEWYCLPYLNKMKQLKNK